MPPAPAAGEAASAVPETPAELTWPAVDRRRGPDRRSRPTSVWQTLTGPRRRARGRRRGETREAYVDRYDRRDLAFLLGVFALNLLDAWLTLRFLDHGGGEANPVMAGLLAGGDWLFLAEKCLFVGFLLIVLIVHKNFRLARIGLWGLLVFYSGLALYHLGLVVAVA